MQLLGKGRMTAKDLQIADYILGPVWLWLSL
jgi:hypothetical protein